MGQHRLLAVSIALAFALAFWPAGAGAQEAPDFIAFESGHVSPLALSPDGTRLAVVNTPDNTLEFFDVGAGGLTFRASVPVGMEPVSVAARTKDEYWVVNHLSDSVSIVDASGSVPFVRQTLITGDEPRDIVFAGTGGNRAFITTAHRGQQRFHPSIASVFAGPSNPADPRLTTPGIDRADVWVFDALAPGNSVGGNPVAVLTFFSDTPRALATDGTTVYVAAFLSGNQTVTVNETLVPDGFADACGPGGIGVGVPGPDDNAAGDDAPETGVIVKFNGSDWVDSLGCTWNHVLPFSTGFHLPDNDVFSFDANTLVKGPIFSSVGTILYGMGINPQSGKVYVANTESPNHVRFEGPGDHGGSTVQGHVSENRITILDPTTLSKDVQHLNQHIDFSKLHTDPGADHAAINAQIDHSLATPGKPVFDSTGDQVYIPALGSQKIGVFTRTELEDPNFENNFDPTLESAQYIATTGGGPSGVALDEANGNLFVTTRFNNSVEVINLATGTTTAVHPLHNPEPESIVAGRVFLYDARNSSNGGQSCNQCHPYGDFDGLPWNLGNPDDLSKPNPQPQPNPLLEFAGPTGPLHPMKGSMQTQSMRGMTHHGSLHWRGDRTVGVFGQDACNEPGYAAAGATNAPCDENLAFLNFIEAFEGLLGMEGTITAEEMQQFADFMLQVQMPPNPVAELDGSLTNPPAPNPSQQRGKDLWFSCGPTSTECAPLDPLATDTVEDCDGCHSLDPFNGFFGTGGEQSFEGEPQHFKVPQNRNMFHKVGYFGTTGNQVRSNGFLHDGSVDTIKTFLSTGPFALSSQEEDDLEAFLFAFPSDLSAVVGQQVTIGPQNFNVADVHARIDLLNTMASTPFESKLLGGAVTHCDVIVKTVEGGVEKGYYSTDGSTFTPDDSGAAISEALLRAKADPTGAGQTLTFTAVPPGGSAPRMGIDRDRDGLPNGVETNTGVFLSASDTGTNPASSDSDGDGWSDQDEVLYGTDPNDPLTFPNLAELPALPAAGLALLALGLLASGIGRARHLR